MTGFPEESWEKAREIVEASKQGNEHTPKYKWAHALMDFYQNAPYGFSANLRNGNYAPWEHEARKQPFATLNCTTIIPMIYMRCALHGLNPRIVQFIDFRNIKDGEEKELCESHFALIINVDRKHDYLFDPFWDTFGPILEHTPHSMRIGRVTKFEYVRRDFKDIISYTEEEFASMMNRLHKPAESLDMLVAGQKLWEAHACNHAKSDLMVYYDDANNEITTRLYIRQVGILDKVVMYHEQFDDFGKSVKNWIELWLARKQKWKGLVDGKHIATMSIDELDMLKRLISADAQKHYRIGSAWGTLRKNNILTQLTEQIYNRLTSDEQQTLKPQLLTRTLYEGTWPRKQYVFAMKQWMMYRKHILCDWRKLEDKRQDIGRLLFDYDEKLVYMPRSEVQRNRRKLSVIDKRMKKKSEKFNGLSRLRMAAKYGFQRTMDKLVFAEKLANSSTDALAQRIEKEKLDWRMGYLAMIYDFVPYVNDKRKDITLEFDKENVRQKIAARRAQPLAS